MCALNNHKGIHQSLQIVFACLLLLLAAGSPVVAQKNEIGGGVGVFNYSGDLVKGLQIGNSRPAATLYYRRNFDRIASGKLAITFGQLAGKDIADYDALSAQRTAEFSTFVAEFSAVFEYNFLDYKAEKAQTRWSPYLFFGVGGFYFSGHENERGSFSSVQPALPFGLGFKFLLNPKFAINVELGTRKLFFDWIDNVSEGDQTIKNYEYGNLYDNDWYHFFGVSLSYSFWNIPCPHDFY